MQIQSEDHQDDHNDTHDFCPYLIGYSLTSTDAVQLSTVDARIIDLHYRIETQRFSKITLLSNQNRGPPEFSMT